MNNFQLKTRRQFLTTSALGAAATCTVPAFLAQTFHGLHAESRAAQQPRTGKDDTILVVLQLAGGNDGLNTVVPVTNDYYYQARPSLALKANLHRLSDEFALHPSLGPLKELFDDGQLAVLHGAGYPNPNRSHFRSTEIWQTASDAQRFERHGWLGRYFDHACQGAEPTVGVSVGRQTPQAFAGPKPLGVSLENPETYRVGYDGAKSSERMEMNSEAENAGGSIGAVAGRTESNLSPLEFLTRTALDAQVSSDRIREVSRRGTTYGSYPASALGTSMKLIARLIGGGLGTRVYYLSQGGYDTHTNQQGAHERLLRDLAGAVKGFTDDMKAQGNRDRVVLMTFSEFGRRVAQNANGGTDHGAAAPMFLAGAKIKPGLLGKFPSLAPADLLNGDPRFTTDFRSIYSSLLRDWLGTNPVAILGREFAGVPVVRES